jgi:hypothetical protein
VLGEREKAFPDQARGVAVLFKRRGPDGFLCSGRGSARQLEDQRVPSKTACQTTCKAAWLQTQKVPRSMVDLDRKGGVAKEVSQAIGRKSLAKRKILEGQVTDGARSCAFESLCAKCLAGRHDGRYDPGELVGQSDGDESRGLARDWPVAGCVKRLQTAANIFDLIYKGEGGIKIEMAMAQRSPRPRE